MARSSIFGVRGLGTAPLQDPQPATPMGRRIPDVSMAAPAHRGGRHHLAGGSVPLSSMLPSRPAPMEGASRQAGGRHHYGEVYARTTPLQGGAPSEDELADQVLADMFGLDVSENEDVLFAEAEMLLSELDDDL